MLDKQLKKITKTFLILLSTQLSMWAQPLLPMAHSHNDYLHARPLFEAIELGVGSLEIDVCLDKKNQIKVAHNPVFLSTKNNIEDMYLLPIIKMMESKDSLFRYSNEHPLTLVIDIKTNGDSTYKYLRRILSKYEKYITQYNYKTREVFPAPLKIALTGGRPIAPILLEEKQLVNVDIGEAGLTINKVESAMVSDDLLFLTSQRNLAYPAYFSFCGIGKPRAKDRDLLNAIVKNTHVYKKPLRLYAIGNNKKVWKFLLDAGVDWINVDKLSKFSKFYNDYKK